MRSKLPIVLSTVALVIAVLGSSAGVGAAVVAFATNAGKVDGKSAVGAGASLNKAKGKLVATRASGANKGTFGPKFLPSKIACPENTVKFAGACLETTATTPADDIFDASETCAARGGQLPTALYLRAYAQQTGVTLDAGGEWSSNVYFDGAYRGLFVTEPSGINDATTLDAHAYRCVYGVAKSFAGKLSGRIVHHSRVSADGS